MFQQVASCDLHDLKNKEKLYSINKMTNIEADVIFPTKN